MCRKFLNFICKTWPASFFLSKKKVVISTKKLKSDDLNNFFFSGVAKILRVTLLSIFFNDNFYFLSDFFPSSIFVLAKQKMHVQVFFKNIYTKCLNLRKLIAEFLHFLPLWQKFSDEFFTRNKLFPR